jgi:hypothetical protein
VRVENDPAAIAAFERGVGGCLKAVISKDPEKTTVDHVGALSR